MPSRAEMSSKPWRGSSHCLLFPDVHVLPPLVGSGGLSIHSSARSRCRPHPRRSWTTGTNTRSKLVVLRWSCREVEGQIWLYQARQRQESSCWRNHYHESGAGRSSRLEVNCKRLHASYRMQILVIMVL